MTIIDGMQRLTAIYQFMDHQSRLHGLQYLYEYQGYLCEELPSLLNVQVVSDSWASGQDSRFLLHVRL